MTSTEDGDDFESTGEQALPPDGVGLCLSGGGYRAMLFHLGSLRRLNEAGWLPRLTRVASVSGGSIVAGQLGVAWNDLEFSGGVARNFGDLVADPILKLAEKTIDVPAVLTGLLTPSRVSARVEKAYDKALFHGASLQDLPSDDEGPRFIILATNLTNGTLWRFSRPYMRDWRSDPIESPQIPLAQAVAASSAFPPFLSPSRLDVPGRPTIWLTDGGVYDNLGVQPVIGHCQTILVSDGGGTFSEQEKPRTDWLRGTLRVLNTIDVQVRRLRRRQVVGLLASDQRDGAFWAINTEYGDFERTSPSLPASREATAALAATATRLAKMERSRARRLVNWGYAACDAAVRSYVDQDLPQPADLPYPTEAL